MAWSWLLQRCGEVIRLMCTGRKVASREITEDTDSEILDALMMSKGVCFYFCWGKRLWNAAVGNRTSLVLSYLATWCTKLPSGGYEVFIPMLSLYSCASFIKYTTRFSCCEMFWSFKDDCRYFQMHTQDVWLVYMHDYFIILLFFFFLVATEPLIKAVYTLYQQRNLLFPVRTLLLKFFSRVYQKEDSKTQRIR